MRITSVDVMSVNGKITTGVDAPASSWASAEDGAHFRQLMDAHDVLVMGRTTYEMAQPQPEAERLRVVLTHEPQKYQAKNVPGQLEFMTASPAELKEQLTKRGFKHVMLIGGEVNTQFWAAGLVDEAYVTIEPVLFGQGRNLLDGLATDVGLHLADIKQLNSHGTLVAHYLVEK